MSSGEADRSARRDLWATNGLGIVASRHSHLRCAGRPAGRPCLRARGGWEAVSGGAEPWSEAGDDEAWDRRCPNCGLNASRPRRRQGGTATRTNSK